MKATEEFKGLPMDFWSNVRVIGQKVGYTVRGEGQVKIPSLAEVVDAYRECGLSTAKIIGPKGALTALGVVLFRYFEYRANMLNEHVEPRLMDVKMVKKEFDSLYESLRPKVSIPMNKQKGEKKAPAYLTGIVNMLIEANAGDRSFSFDPRELTTITKGGVPVRTLSRRMDGAFPGPIDPIAVWEIKEYYYTTTFGSRVADGVYESMLDGFEIREANASQGLKVQHYLIVDDHYTWWDCGRSYLCRLMDMLNMGLVDGILFGFEVIEELPDTVREWLRFEQDSIEQN